MNSGKTCAICGCLDAVVHLSPRSPSRDPHRFWGCLSCAKRLAAEFGRRKARGADAR